MQRVPACMIAEIDLLAADSDARGQGIGIAVLDEAERWLESQGRPLVTATVAGGG
ncbi:GNAT family N-acetyltransferase [Streptomyces sp. NPDC053367]|uniref:GNAT family N-acetyltransferase n=1 Tax=Streptomyces sp. NPDC053367 TaxID=3365700 RepID=UPI0037D569B3